MFMRLSGLFEMLRNMIRNFSVLALSALCIVTIGPTSQVAIAETPTSVKWQTPFATPHQLIRNYIQPNSDYSAGHRGVDFAVSLDEIILAPSVGMVTYAGRLVNRPVLALSHEGGLKSEFEPACTTLKVGDEVLAGDPIGTVCPAEVNYAQHCPDVTCLHFSLRLDGKYLSPLALIGGLNPSRLLPYDRH